MNYTDYYALQDKHKQDFFDILSWEDKYALENLCKQIYKYKDPENPDDYYNDWIAFHTTEFWLGELMDREYLVRVCVDCGIFIYSHTDTFGRKFYEVNPSWREFLKKEFKLDENEKRTETNIH